MIIKETSSQIHFRVSVDPCRVDAAEDLPKELFVLYYDVVWMCLNPNGKDAEHFLCEGLLVDTLAVFINAGQFFVHLVKELSSPDTEFLAFDSGMIN